MRRDEKRLQNFSRNSYSAYTTQQDNIKTHLRETDFQSVDRILNKYIASVSTGFKWHLPGNGGGGFHRQGNELSRLYEAKNSLTIWETNRTSSRTLPVEIFWPSLARMCTAYMRFLYRILITIASILSYFVSVFSILTTIRVTVDTKQYLQRLSKSE